MIELLGRGTSSNVQKVEWALRHLGLAYHRQDVGGSFGGTTAEAYVARNPTGLIPTLIDGPVAVWESNAILRYLANRYGPSPLYPTDPVARAAVDQWLDWQATAFANAQRPVFWTLIRTPPDRRDAAVLADGVAQENRMVQILDRALSDDRPWLCGPDMTLADIACGPLTYRHFNLDFVRTDTPHARAWYERMTGDAAFRDVVMIDIV